MAFVKDEGERLGLRITVGRGVVEARPPIRADKGTAVRTLVEEYRPKKAMFMGDDTTDLDAFRELERLREEGRLREILRVGVASDEGPPEIVTEADIVVDGVDGVGEGAKGASRPGLVSVPPIRPSSQASGKARTTPSIAPKVAPGMVTRTSV